MTQRIGIVLALAVLAGCSGDKQASADGAAEAAAASGASGGAAEGWDATQACAMLDVGKLSGLTGVTFTTAKFTPITSMSEATAATSRCEYSGAGGAMVTLLAREAPFDDATPEAIEMARTANGMMEPAEDVPGLGKAALWRAAPMGKTLQVFFDERRSVVVALGGRDLTLDQAQVVARAVTP